MQLRITLFILIIFSCRPIDDIQSLESQIICNIVNYINHELLIAPPQPPAPFYADTFMQQNVKIFDGPVFDKVYILNQFLDPILGDTTIFNFNWAKEIPLADISENIKIDIEECNSDQLSFKSNRLWPLINDDFKSVLFTFSRPQINGNEAQIYLEFASNQKSFTAIVFSLSYTDSNWQVDSWELRAIS